MKKTWHIANHGIFILLISACQSSVPTPSVMTTSALVNTDIPVEPSIQPLMPLCRPLPHVNWKIEVVAETYMFHGVGFYQPRT
jgi:hypothetical protein